MHSETEWLLALLKRDYRLEKTIVLHDYERALRKFTKAY